MRTQFKFLFLSMAVAALSIGFGCDSGKPSGGTSSSGGSSSSSGGSSESESSSGGGSSESESGSTSAEAPAEGGWGTLTGRFVYGGDPPAQTNIKIDKDVEFCTMNNPLTEEIVVDPDTKGIANVVAMLYLPRGKTAPVHESYGDPAESTIAMDNEWCRFEPHVQFAQTGATVAFGNKDKIGHNVKGTTFSPGNSEFNKTVAAGETLPIVFNEAERLPVAVSCTIHPWMKGFVVVQDHPYVAISGKDGSFKLDNLPSGEWELTIWQESAGYLKQLKVGDKTNDLNRGRWKVNVYDDATEGNAEKNAVGDLVITAKNFE